MAELKKKIENTASEYSVITRWQEDKGNVGDTVGNWCGDAAKDEKRGKKEKEKPSGGLKMKTEKICPVR